MFDFESLLSFMQGFPDYMRSPSAQAAVCLPTLIGTALWYPWRRTPLPEFSGALFVSGIALSVIFSMFRSFADEQAFHALPGYALLLVLMPPRLQPHWSQAYGLSFLSQLITDIWGTATHFLNYEPVLSPTFYYGIGGAGFHDSLFITPWILTAVILSSDWMRRIGIADKGIGSLGRALMRSRPKPGYTSGTKE